jgi:deoxycytidine triphosphate deaminase
MTMKNISSDAAQSELSFIQPVDVQPNAVDLRLQRVLRVKPETFTLSEEEKVHRGTEEVMPGPDGYFTLAPGVYEVLMANQIKVGENEAGWVITRSTLNRNGVFLTSGLYDSGYIGPMASVMHVTAGIFRVRIGTRIGQYLCFDAEAVKQYNGSYGYTPDGAIKQEQAALYGNTVPNMPPNTPPGATYHYHPMATVINT